MQKIQTRKKKRPRDSDEDTIERLNEELRELKSLNRSLMRRLKKLDRNYQEHTEDLEEDFNLPVKSISKKCPTCKVGELSEVTIESLGKKYMKCLGFGCRYRSTTEKL